MEAADVMSRIVISVSPETSVGEAARVMVDNNISAVAVVDATGRLVGMVSEGDLVRRAELGTDRKASHWLELFASPGELASEYVRSRARHVGDIMTREVVTVGEHTPLREIVDLLERKRIKRVPVVRDGVPVGIVSRANLLRGFGAADMAPKPPRVEDRQIREAYLAELKRQPWADSAGLNVIVSDGTLHVWGVVRGPEERRALRVAAETIDGVQAYADHLVQLPALPPV